jgi:hypothetical protein
VTWETVGWRLASWDTPFWIGPNRRDGRYNQGGGDATQYVCLHPWAPWAEMLRWEDRRTVPEAMELQGRLWSARITLPDPPLTIDFADAYRYGVTPADLVSESYRPCQELAARLRAARHEAVMVPSAALPGSQTLVMLGPRVLIPWQLPPIDPLLDTEAAVTADRAGAPTAVLPHVRWRHAPHTGLAAFHAGTSAPFLEPVPTPL